MIPIFLYWLFEDSSMIFPFYSKKNLTDRKLTNRCTYIIV